MSGSNARVVGVSIAAMVTALAPASCTRPENTVPATDSTLAGVVTTGAGTTGSTEGATTVAATSTTHGGATTNPTTNPTGTAAPGTTTSAPRTTVPNSLTVPAPDPRDDLTLIFDGVVPFRFGDRDVDVVPALADALGAPVSDTVAEYPTAEAGVFLDPNGEESYVAPFGRTVCYANGLCVQFGAGARETLIFTGWRLDDRAPSELTTDDGIRIGSTLAEHAEVITLDPARNCGSVASGAAAGIDVTLISTDGTEIGDADPALVTVRSMSAGELPVDLLADC